MYRTISKRYVIVIMQYSHFFPFFLYVCYSTTLLVQVNVLIVTGFTTTLSSSSSPTRVNTYRYRYLLPLVTNQSSFYNRQNHFLFLSKQQEEQEHDDDSTLTLEKLQTNEKSNKDASLSSSKITSDAINQNREVSYLIFKLFSYILQFMGIYFSFGLLLNILGFGYYIDLDSFKNNSGGLIRIDKRNVIQNELQFKNEIKNPSRSNSGSRLSSISSGNVMDLYVEKQGRQNDVN